MQKIISFTSKDFLSGITEYPYITNNGFWRLGQMNPYSRPGLIQPSVVASGLTNGTTVIDLAQSFVQNSSDLYAMGDAGNFYKISNFNTGASATVSNLRTSSTFTNPAYGLEMFRTKVGATPKVYYWRGASTGTGYIGEYDLGVAWNDTKFTISPSYPSTIHPILRIDDEIYFGSGYVLSKIYDDLTNADPQLLENILDLPTDRSIVSLETDGTYLIILANITNNKESKIYYWDYKNKLDSWTLEYTIPDVCNQLKNIKGTIYAIGVKGLYAFNSATEPIKVRGDIKNLVKLGMVKYNDGLFIGGTTQIKSYGNILPNVKTGVFTPFDNVAVNAMIFPSSTGLNYMFFSYLAGGVNYIKFQDITAVATQTTSGGLEVSSSMVDLGQSFIIKRVNLIFVNKLVSGQTIGNVYLGGILNTDTAFNSPTFSDYGSTQKCELLPTNGELTTDTLIVRLDDSSGGLGNNSIKRIDIYGEPSIK